MRHGANRRVFRPRWPELSRRKVITLVRCVRGRKQENKNDKVPANQTRVKNIDDPNQPPHAHSKDHCYHLAHHHTTYAPEMQRKPRDQRIQFDATCVENGDRGQQIQHLKHSKCPVRTEALS